MKISVAVPEAVRLHLGEFLPGIEQPIVVEIDGALLSLTFAAGATADQRLESLVELEARLGLEIADVADTGDAAIINALGELKRSVASIAANLRRESLYTSAAVPVIAEATVVDDVSQLHVNRNASISNASEQHGAADDVEENEDGQTEQEQGQQPSPRTRRGK